MQAGGRTRTDLSHFLSISLSIIIICLSIKGVNRLKMSFYNRAHKRTRKETIYLRRKKKERNIHAPDVIDVRELHIQREINKSLIKKTATNNYILIYSLDYRL